MTIDSIILGLLFFLPAGISNMTPVFSNRIPGLNRWKTPLDFGKSYRGHRIFGQNKTWRGLVTGTVIGTVVGVALYPAFFANFTFITYLSACVAMAAGALIGDAIESFFKRQHGVPAGKPWFPFDQTDYIIGALLLLAPFSVLTLPVVFAILFVYFGLHLISSYIGYRIGLKDLPI